jgi:hypothetical protein
MTTSTRAIVLAATFVLAALSAPANDLNRFETAIQQATTQYRIALQTLETSGREQTAAEVRLLRQAWQEIIDQYEASRPAELEGADVYATEIDARLVGALIVIDIGSREAAREALMPIGDTLARLRDRAGAR